MLLFRFNGDNDASKRVQDEACFSCAEREHHRDQSLTGRKGTAIFSFPQEGTFWCHSSSQAKRAELESQKVGIVMLSGFAENDFNFD